MRACSAARSSSDDVTVKAFRPAAAHKNARRDSAHWVLPLGSARINLANAIALCPAPPSAQRPQHRNVAIQAGVLLDSSSSKTHNADTAANVALLNQAGAPAPPPPSTSTAFTHGAEAP